jgi:hypothetical protein
MVLAAMVGLAGMVCVVFGPAIVLGFVYRSAGLAVTIVFTTLFASTLFTIVLVPLELAIATPGSEGSGAGAYVLGPALGWLCGIIVPLYGMERRRKDAAATGLLRARGPRRTIATAGSERTPDYATYTWAQLQDAAAHVNRARYPDIARAIDDEIATRLRG